MQPKINNAHDFKLYSNCRNRFLLIQNDRRCLSRINISPVRPLKQLKDPAYNRSELHNILYDSVL